MKHNLPLWLVPHAEAEYARMQKKHKEKFGGPDANTLNVELVKGVSQTSHYGCVFYDSIRHDCLAGLVTKNVDIHNGCFNSGKIWQVKT